MSATDRAMPVMNALLLVVAGALTVVASCAPPAPPAADRPVATLPSWNDGAAKKAITRFVSRVTTEGGPDFVAGARAHRRVRQRRHAVGRAADVLPARVRPRSGEGARPAASGVADTRAVQERARRRHEGRHGRRRARAAGDHGGLACRQHDRRVRADRRRTGWRRRSTRRPAGSTPRWSTSRCSRSWPTCAPTASRPTSCRAAAWSSCGRGWSGSTASRPSRWSAAAAR